MDLEASAGISTQAGMAEALGSGASVTADDTTTTTATTAAAATTVRDEAVAETAEKMSRCGSESDRLGERAIGLAYGQVGAAASVAGAELVTDAGDLAAASDAAGESMGSPVPELPGESPSTASGGSAADSDWSIRFCNQVKLVTLAPELPGAGAVIEWLSRRGVVVSMGHTSATVDDGERAIARGATLITHLFNAMSGFHHRDPGLIGLLGRQCSGQSTAPVAKHVELATRQQALHDTDGTDAGTVGHSSSSNFPLSSSSSSSSSSSVFAPHLSPLLSGPTSSVETEEVSDLIGRPAALRLHPPSVTPRPWYSVIVDGIHAHPYAVTMAFTAHPAGLVLVTDGIAALGLPCGSHSLGDMAVTVSNADSQTTSASSSASLSLASSSSSSSDTAHGTIGSLTRGTLTLEPLTPLTRSGQARETRLRADLSGTNTLAGAVLPLDACVRNLAKFTRCTRATAIAAASSRPAAVVGEASRRGALSAGMRADLVLLDASNLSPVQTWIAGRPAWTRHDGLTT
jgi:N-acetylglucosamine-6-phosphate deacetylase